MKLGRNSFLEHICVIGVAGLFLTRGWLAAQGQGEVRPPMPPSPVELFRQLLASPDAEKKYLEARSPELRERISKKLDEYRSFSDQDRELKLRNTEMRWYLMPLLNTGATNRAAQLVLIPASVKPLVEKQIQRWDKLPESAQMTLRTNERAIAYFTTLEQAPPPPPPSPKDALRQKLNAFGKLSPAERAKALRALPEEERRQVEQTLTAVEKLKPDQRENFAAFASLSETERSAFLNNAQRWKQMSQSERAAWRELVNRAPIAPPPLPPDLQQPPVTNKDKG